MRKTDINQVISYKDVKAGDKISVTGVLEVKSARLVSDSPKLGNAAIVDIPAPGASNPAERSTYAVLESDTVTLLERDVELSIPDDALIVIWQDTDDCDYYARKLDDGRWRDSYNQEHDSAEDLVEAILDDDYQVDSFEVIKREKPKYAQGGYVYGAGKPHLHIGGASSGLSARLASDNLNTLARSLGMVR